VKVDMELVLDCANQLSLTSYRKKKLDPSSHSHSGGSGSIFRNDFLSSTNRMFRLEALGTTKIPRWMTAKTFLVSCGK